MKLFRDADYPECFDDPENRARILKALRMGGTRPDACIYARCPPSMLNSYLMEHDGNFQKEIIRAEVIGKLRQIRRVTKGHKDWRAAAWYLARKYYQEYGQRDPDSFTKDQVVLLLMRFSQIVADEVDDKVVMKRVSERMYEVLSTLEEARVRKGMKKRHRRSETNEEDV